MYDSDLGAGPSCPKKYRVSEWGDAFVEHVSNSDDLKAYEKVCAHNTLLIFTE